MASRAHRGVGEEVGQGQRLAGGRELVEFSSATVRPTLDQGLIGGSQVNTPRVPTQELRELVERSPEASNAIDWLTHGASRAALFPCQLTDEGLPGVRTKDADVIAATQPLTGPMYASDFLEQGSWHMLVPGEFYLYGYDNERAYRETERQRWAVVDADNVSEQGGTGSGGYRVRYERDGREKEDVIAVTAEGGLTAPLIRIWNPDKKEPWRATSPILSNLQVLRALDKMTKLVPALADQRISGPRILAVSNRLELPDPTPKRRFSKNKIVDRLARAVDAAKRNPSSIENLLPIILSGDLSEEVFKKLEWSTEFPELTVNIMELLLKRLATGLPVPSEVTLGESGTSHWGQWFNEESTVKLSIEPLVTKIASALSRQWLPVVLPFGRDINEWVIGHDVRSVMLRPDRSAIAVQLFELGELNGQALRRETGFDEKDAPTAAEIARRQNQGQLPGGQAPGPDPGQGDRRPQQQVDLDPEAGRAARALPSGAPGGSPSGGGVDRGLQAAAMVTVTAALARVGSYLKGNREFRGMVNGLPTCDIYTRAPVSLRSEVNDERIWPDGVLEVFLSSAKTAGCDPECAEALMRRHLQLCVSKARPEPIEFLIDGLNQCSRAPVEVG